MQARGVVDLYKLRLNTKALIILATKNMRKKQINLVNFKRIDNKSISRHYTVTSFMSTSA